MKHNKLAWKTLTLIHLRGEGTKLDILFYEFLVARQYGMKFGQFS